MSNQLQITGGGKVRNLEGVITGTSGVLSSVPLGAANGVATLDSGGKVPVSQLPSSVVTYLGTWNAATNTPTLVNGTGDAGDMYICNVAGTVNFGAGPVVFVVGDWVLYGSGTWQKSSGQNGTVTSVGLSTNAGAITIGNSPISTSGTISFNFNGTNLQYVNGAGNLTTFPTLMTSVGLTMPSAFTVANSPLTGAGGTLAVTGAGVASQYIRGDGTLANFPTSGGGGSSVAYYFNSSVSQGTLGGVAYRELSKVPIIGAGTDITIATNGYIANYITDAGDPSLLEIPAGNWNFEMFFSASSGGGSPSFYVELYKYDGTTFTLISSSSATPEGITNGTAIDLYTTALAVPLTTLTLTDRLAIRVYVNNSSRTITLHTENSHLCEVITTFSTGIAALNGLTAQVQYFQTGTSGTDFNISSTTATHTFNIPDASATARGLITTGTQTIAGTKTFSDATKNNGGIFLQNASSGSLAGYMNIGGLTNGVKFTSGGGVSNTFTLPSATGYTFTFPNATGTIALTSDISYPVTSVFGRTGAVVATSGDYTTAQVTESGNLYFTDSRARLALSFVAGSGAYNSTTGVITIPTNNNQITNGASYITLTSLTAGTGISYNNTTGVITNSAPDQTVSLTAGAGISVSGTYPSFTIASTITQYTDALARAALSFAAGSGAYNSTTGVITIPTDNSQIANGAGYITSSALSGYLPLTGGTLTGALNINLSSGTAMNVAGNAIFRGDTGVGTPRQLIITSGGSTPVYLEAKGYGANYQTDFGIKTFNSVGTAFEVFYADSSGRVGINQTSPSYQLDVNGTGRFSNLLTVLANTGGNAINIVGRSADGFGFLTFKNNANSAINGEIGISDAQNMLFYTGASVRLTIASTGQATFTGAYINTSDVGIIVSASIPAINFRASASGRFTIATSYSNSNRTSFIVGTGTSNPTIEALQIEHSTGAATFSSSVNIGGDLALTPNDSAITFSSGAGRFFTGGSERMRITSGGNVLVGTTSTSFTGNAFLLRMDNASYPYIQISASGSISEVFYAYNSNGLIGSIGTNGTAMTFSMSTTEKMRITSGGALCLGVTSAYGTNLLNVNGGIYATSSIAAVVAADIDMFVFSNTGASYSKSCIVASMVATGGTGSYFFYGQQSTSTVALKIFSNGNIQNTNNSYGAISDARLKENIIDATPKLDDLMKVKVRNYNLKGESNKQLGVISQELEAIFPNMIEESTNIGSDVKIKGVKYSVFVPMLIKAVQELKAEIEILKNK